MDIWYIENKVSIELCMLDTNIRIMTYYNSEEAMLADYKKLKAGYFPNRRPVKKGKAEFNSDGLLLPMGIVTQKLIK